MRMHLRVPVAAFVATSLGLVLAGCSGGAATTRSTTADGHGTTHNQAATAGVPAEGTSGLAPGASTGSTSATAPVAAEAALSTIALAGRDLVLTASLTVRGNDVATMTRRTEQLVARVHGYVASEQVEGDPAQTGSDTATISLRVPQSSYATTVSAIAGLGTLVTKQQGAADVTDQVVDTSSRLATAKAGLARVRTLLDRATSLGQVIDLEAELSKREASLESLEQRLATLQRQVALATIEVTFSRNATAVSHHHQHHAGFVTGILNGWHAFTRTGNGLLTGLGAALPFVLALLAVLAGAVLVRRRHHQVPSQIPTLGDDVAD